MGLAPKAYAESSQAAAHEKRVALYAERASMGLAIFTGLPLGAEAFEGIEEEDSTGVERMLADSMTDNLDDCVVEI